MNSPPKALSILYTQKGTSVWEYQAEPKILLKGFYDGDSATTFEWAKRTLFSERELWKIFDALVPGSDIFLVEPSLDIPSSIQKISKNRSLKEWALRTHSGIVAWIVLSKQGSGYYLAVHRVTPYVSPLKPLLFTYNGGLNQFTQFKNQGDDLCVLKKGTTCSLVSTELPTLRASLFSNGNITFTYSEVVEKPLSGVQQYKLLSLKEQKEFRTIVRGYLNYEYNLMIKAAIGSATTLFNWQLWEWLDHFDSGAPSDDALHAWLSAGESTRPVELFKYIGTDFVVLFFCNFDGERSITIEKTQ
ncbi:MAG: hypothetical protein OCD01_14805 [Fibrobacterales bacterium]